MFKMYVENSSTFPLQIIRSIEQSIWVESIAALNIDNQLKF